MLNILFSIQTNNFILNEVNYNFKTSNPIDQQIYSKIKFLFL